MQRKTHFSRESSFLAYVKDFLTQNGHEILNPEQKNWNWKTIPDIVSSKDGVIYLSELKHCLTREYIIKAIGQMIVYKYCYYPDETTILNIISPKDNCIIGIDDLFMAYLKDNHGINILLL